MAITMVEAKKATERHTFDAFDSLSSSYMRVLKLKIYFPFLAITRKDNQNFENNKIGVFAKKKSAITEILCNFASYSVITDF